MFAYISIAGGGFINTTSWESKLSGKTRPYNTINHTRGGFKEYLVVLPNGW